MKYIKLGRSNMEVSRISLGTHHLDNPVDVDRHAENIVYAYQKGINFFETSVSYGDGYSELILGEAIKEMKKGEMPFYIMSKCHFADHETFRQNLENTLTRLGIDCIDAFTCLWGVKSYYEWEGAKRFGAIKELEQAKEEGLIKHIAISTHMRDEDMAKVMQDYPFDFNIIGFNVVNAPYRLEGLKASYISGAGNIAMTPLGTGDILEFPDVFSAIKMRKNQSLVQAAYDFLLSSPYIHSVLGSFNDKSQIDEAIYAMEHHIPYSQAELEQVHVNLHNRIHELPLNTRFEVASAIRKRAYILRDEAADLLEVYPMSIK